jgi:hypothetical protein
MLKLSHPEEAKRLIQLAQNDVLVRQRFYQQLASFKFEKEENK